MSPFHRNVIRVSWLDLGTMDPMGLSGCLDCSRSEQNHKIGSCPPRFEVWCLMALHPDPVSSFNFQLIEFYERSIIGSSLINQSVGLVQDPLESL